MPRKYAYTITPFYIGHGRLTETEIAYDIGLMDDAGAQRGVFQIFQALDGSKICAGPARTLLAAPVPQELATLTPSQSAAPTLQKWIATWDVAGLFDAFYP